LGKGLRQKVKEIRRKLCSLLTGRGIEELSYAREIRKRSLEVKKGDT